MIRVRRRSRDPGIGWGENVRITRFFAELFAAEIVPRSCYVDRDRMCSVMPGEEGLSGVIN